MNRDISYYIDVERPSEGVDCDQPTLSLCNADFFLELDPEAIRSNGSTIGKWFSNKHSLIPDFVDYELLLKSLFDILDSLKHHLNVTRSYYFLDLNALQGLI